jgi:hypothetical protein
MNELESQVATAQELVSFAREHGLHLEAVCHEWAFLNAGRLICLWRKNEVVHSDLQGRAEDELPGSGAVNEPPATLHYSMQGAVSVLPQALKDSAGAFRGMWVEAGTFKDLEQALAFLKAWLIDRKEVDDLPLRCVRSFGI